MGYWDSLTVRPGRLTVSFEELSEPSPSPLRESFSPEGGFEVERALKCDWDDRLDLARELLGHVQTVGGQTIYTQPHRYPDFETAIADSVSIAPFGRNVSATSGSDPINDYESAVLGVHYAVPENQDPTGQGLVTESIEGAAEFITVPHEDLHWDNGTGALLKADEAPGQLIKMLEWVFVLHHVTNIPSEVFDLVGRCNSTAITSVVLGKEFGVETLLYNPPSLRREITTDGVGAWELTFRFTWRPGEWNKFPRAGKSVMEHIYLSGGGIYRPYPTANLSVLADYNVNAA